MTYDLRVLAARVRKAVDWFWEEPNESAVAGTSGERLADAALELADAVDALPREGQHSPACATNSDPPKDDYECDCGEEREALAVWCEEKADDAVEPCEDCGELEATADRPRFRRIAALLRADAKEAQR